MNIKKRIRLLLPILFLLLAVPVRAEECAHEFVEKHQEPKCEDPGMVWQECIYCGAAKEYDNIPALGHTFGEWYILTHPSCSAEGVRARDCSVCGKQDLETIPALEHEYQEEVIAPTCTARGRTLHYCLGCTARFTTDYVPALGHQYDDGILIREPTDTAMGRVRFTCIRCQETYQMTYTFRDLNADGYYFTPVIWALNNGITSGIDETHFGPDQPCSRAQVVTFLWRAAGKPEPVLTENPFTDVPAGCFYETAVLWAYENGITTGTDGTHFSPNAPCIRAQVVTFLHRFRGCPQAESGTAFPDVKPGTYYYEAVLWAAQRRITLGMDGGYFRPELICNRAQIVTFLYRDEKNP